jgi:hypothetical protein
MRFSQAPDDRHELVRLMNGANVGMRFRLEESQDEVRVFADDALVFIGAPKEDADAFLLAIYFFTLGSAYHLPEVYEIVDGNSCQG